MTGNASAVNALLNHATDRQRAVIVGRFGLDGKEPQTLATIGMTFGITRERVRQIEVGGISALRAVFAKDKALNSLVDQIEKCLKGMSGVAKKDDCVAACESLGGGLTTSQLIFLARVSGRFHFSPETEETHAFFYSDDKTSKRAEGVIAKLVKYMNGKQGKADMSGRSMLENFVRSEKLDRALADRCVSVSKAFHVNTFGDFGLAEWPEIRPQTIRDRIYLVLKKKREPMHFRDISLSINDAGLGKKLALVPTVHNELIKDERFILVGRGMYALHEHGFEAGTARDVIARILKREGPLSSEDIVLAVQKERFFKPNTVIANLQNKRNFLRRVDGLYQVREA
ncbi:MAG: sigma factor-like helix-turn-helix DNA-binding protein [Patescibacteria group bacterium]